MRWLLWNSDCSKVLMLVESCMTGEGTRHCVQVLHATQSTERTFRLLVQDLLLLMWANRRASIPQARSPTGTVGRLVL
jgi:transcriptional regulatory protein LevR